MRVAISISILLVVLFGFTSCDPIKRHQRLVDRFPYVHEQDTLYITDSVYVPKVEHDTVTHIRELLDTIHVNHDRLEVKVYRVRDSVYIEGQCRDTVIVEERVVPIRYFEKTPGWMSSAKWILIALFILAVLYFVLQFRKQR